jgi:hypothetical protein
MLRSIGIVLLKILKGLALGAFGSLLAGIVVFFPLALVFAVLGGLLGAILGLLASFTNDLWGWATRLALGGGIFLGVALGLPFHFSNRLPFPL